jgi:hypothetical protein
MKPASPAQLAARKRFAEMARSGAFKKKAIKRKTNPITETVIWGLAPGENRDYMEEIMYGGGQKLTKEQVDMVIAAATKAGYHSFRIGGIDMTKKPDFSGAVKTTKRKTNPLIISAEADKSLGYYGSRGHIRKLLEDYANSGRVVSVRKKRGSNAIGVAFSGGKEVTLEKAKIYLENLVNEGILKPSPVKPFRMNNPIDTYIEKFHLGGKIYAQIIEKSDKTFDYYVYQMQSTGIPGEKPYEQFFDSKNYKTKLGAMRGLEKWAMRHQYKVTPQLHTNPAKKTVSKKISQLVHEGYPQRQAVAVALSEQRSGKVKRNPSKRTYEVYCQSPGMNIHSWTKLATFYSAEKAKQYAKTYAKAYPSHYVRVESHG